jgi:hypothetical protein
MAEPLSVANPMPVYITFMTVSVSVQIRIDLKLTAGVSIASPLPLLNALILLPENGFKRLWNLSHPTIYRNPFPSQKHQQAPTFF